MSLMGLPTPTRWPHAVGVGEGEQVATVLSFGYPRLRATRSAARPEQWIERANRKPFDDVVSER